MPRDALLHKIHHALETGNRAKLEASLHPEFTYRDHNDDVTLDRDDFIRYVLNLHEGIPDIRYHLGDLHEQDGLVRGVRHLTGTHNDRLDLSPVRDLTLLATRHRIDLPPERVVFRLQGQRLASYAVQRTHGAGTDGILHQIGNARALTPWGRAAPLDALA